jgi:hypothetical protein
VKAFQIADNRLCEIGEWDDKLLAEAFKELSFIEIEQDLELMELTGFDGPEIDLRIQSLHQPQPAQEDRVDSIPALVGPAVTKPGDIWIVGRHRIVCGNPLDPATYEGLLEGRKAEIVFTDHALFKNSRIASFPRVR